MSLNPDGRENKIKLISDTMTGFYSVMRNLQEDYKTYSKNYSEEALALLSRSDDFIESVEAVRSLDSLSRIDDEGINELFLLSQQIAELYHLNVQRGEKTSEEAMEQEAPQISNKLDGKTDLFTLFVNEVSKEIGNVIHIDEGMRITFRLDALDKNAKYKTDWATKKESGTEEKSFYSLVSLIKNTADDDSMDREITFEELGEYTVSAKVYKVMKQSLFASMKELVRDYEFKVVVDESDDLYATMDFWDKLFKALKDVNWKEVASASAEEVLKTLPVVVGTIILLSGVLIAISMTPVGLLTPMVGAAMQYFGVANGIKDILAGLYLFTDAVIQVKEAKSSGAMKQASALFTKAFKYVGPNLLMDILMFFGGKAIKNVKGGNKIESVKQKSKKHYKNAKQAVGKNINDINSIEGYEKFTRKDGTTGLRRQKGMSGKLEQLSVDKDGVIHNIDVEKANKTKKRINNKRDSWTKLQKGNYGEMKMHEYYEKNGYTIISKDPVRNINAKGHLGIDGVYYKKGGHPPYIIGEAKFGSSSLSKLSDGTKQMSKKWIMDRLSACCEKEKDAQLIRFLIEKMPDKVGFELVNVNKSGITNIKKLKG